MWFAIEHRTSRVIAESSDYRTCSDEAFKNMPWENVAPYILTTETPKECSICYGRGIIEDYENHWKCAHCEGTGYSINVVDDKCHCSDGPFHYKTCPKYDANKPNSFEQLGKALTK